MERVHPTFSTSIILILIMNSMIQIMCVDIKICRTYTNCVDADVVWSSLIVSITQSSFFFLGMGTLVLADRSLHLWASFILPWSYPSHIINSDLLYSEHKTHQLITNKVIKFIFHKFSTNNCNYFSIKTFRNCLPLQSNGKVITFQNIIINKQMKCSYICIQFIYSSIQHFLCLHDELKSKIINWIENWNNILVPQNG